MSLKLALLASIVGTLAAFTGPTASAVTVTDEATGEPCPDVVEVIGGNPEVSGGCPIQGESNGHIEFAGPFGIMLLCDGAGEGRVDSSGHTLLANYFFSCELGNKHACTSAGERHPEGRVTGEGEAQPDGSEVFPGEVQFCVDVEQPIQLGELECHLEGNMVEVSHDSGYAAIGQEVHEPCENGAFAVMGRIDYVVDAAHPALEISN